MLRIVARVLGSVIALLACAGFFVEGAHLANLMNVDIALDLLRGLCAGALLVVGIVQTPSASVRAVLAVTGVAFVVLGLLGSYDPTVFGMLPMGLTVMDVVFHVFVGFFSLLAACMPTRVPAIDASSSLRASKG
jgi:hypothetical protein